MSIGETFSRLLLKQLVDDVFLIGGIEARDAVVDFLSRCCQPEDRRLTTALEYAMHRAWRALESALSGEPLRDYSQAGFAPQEAQVLRQCLERVLTELAHGGSGTSGATRRIVANGLRRQCLVDLCSARAARALSGCLGQDEWARSTEIFIRFSIPQSSGVTRRRTEGQLLRDLEQQGCVGLMRILTAGSGLPLLLMAARAFVCQELVHLLYRCLQESPQQIPDHCTLVLDILHELSRPRFSVWRAPTHPAKPVHWSRLESGSSVRSPARACQHPLPPRIFESYQRRQRGPKTPRSSWMLLSTLTILVGLLAAAPIWLLVEEARQQESGQQRLALERHRLREERQRVEAERQQLIDTQRRIARNELIQQQELRRQREEAERRRKEEEHKRRLTEERAVARRLEERCRLAAEREARLREQQQRLARARVALEDGLRFAARGEDRQAETALSEALRLDPSLRGWSVRGKVRRRLGDVAGALSDFHEAVRRDPDDVRCWFQCGQLHAARHDYPQAIDAFTKVLQSKPADVEAYRQRGLCHAGNGDTDKALADQTKAIDLEPNDPWAYFHRADLHRRRGSLDSAFADYTAAIDRDHFKERGLSGAYRRRGLIYLHRRQYKQAIRDLTQALELNPSDLAAQQARGLAYLRRGDWNRALLDAEEVIQHNPDSSAAYKLRGHAYLGLREYRQAHDDFTRALRRERDAETFYLRACAKAHLGEINEAIYDCNRATAIDPKLARAFYLRGRLHFHEGYRASALADHRTAHELDPQFPRP